MNECSAYVGLDVHKDTIAVALPGRGEPVYRGELNNQRKPLKARGIHYVYLGRELSGRPDDPALYDEGGQVDYVRVAQASDFRDGAAWIIGGAAKHRIALMCAEKKPLDCHRRLVAEYLNEHWGGVRIEHLAMEKSG